MRGRRLLTFISYAHLDWEARDLLRFHALGPLVGDGMIELWDDQANAPGEEFDPQIQKRLDEAKVVILLVSPRFIASGPCASEMERALERHASRAALVLPVILSECDWKKTPLGKLEVIPDKGTPIEAWPGRAGWENAARRIREAIEARYPRTRIPATPALGALAIGLIALGAWVLTAWPPWQGVMTQPDAGPEQVETGRPTPPLSAPLHLVEVLVDSSPPGTITLSAGGKALEHHQSPMRVRVPPGTYQLDVSGVQAVKDEYGSPCSSEIAFHKREPLIVEADRSTVKHTIRLEQGTVVIKTMPASRVTIETAHCGSVPLGLTLREGTYNASFECDPEVEGGCANRPRITRTIEVKPGPSQLSLGLWP
jgi:TIR domain-containing protein